MKTKILFLLPFLLTPSLGYGQSAPAWKSYQDTGNPADMVKSTQVSSWLAKKVDVASGTSTNQMLTTPTITGGTVSGTNETTGVATASSGTTSRTHAAHYADVTNVMDYGAVASPTIDNTAAFQAAITAACSIGNTSSGGTAYPGTASASSGDVFIPHGVYGVVGPINWTCPISLHGAGKSATTLIWTGTGSSSLMNMSAPLTDSSRYWYHGAVHDMNVDVTGSQTGAVFRTSQCSHCDIYNVSTYGAYRSFVAYAGMWITLHDFDFQQGHVQATNGSASGTEKFSTGIEWYGSDNDGGTNCTASNNGNCLTRGDVLSIYNGYVSASLDGIHEPTDCLYIHDFAATTWVRGLVCEQVRNGVNVRCDNSVAIGNCPQFMHLDRLEAETNNTVATDNNYGIVADNFASMECYSCQLYASQAGPNNIALNNTRFHSGNFQWFGGKIQNSLGMCVVSRIDGAAFHGGYVLDCGEDGTTGDKWGIGFLKGTATVSENNSVNDMQFCHDGVGGTQTDMYPVDIDSTTTHSIVSGSILTNCAGTSSNNNSSGGNVIVNEVGP